MLVRRLLSWLLVLVMSVSLTLAFVADVARADDGATYTVRYGDNLTSIAAHNGITVQALAQANGIANVNNIYVGQVLKLPSAKTTSTPTPITPSEQAYIVQSGDTLSGIAYRYNISLYDLASANHLSVMSYIYTGQTLKIPQSSQPTVPTNLPPTATPVPATTIAPTPTVTPPLATTAVATKGNTYTVQHGDSLSSIAAKFNVTVDALVQTNHISDPSMIIGGQTLIIPALGQGGAPIVTTAIPVAPSTTTQAASQPVVANTSGKWIDVNLSSERLTAYEGSNPVFTTLVSIGVASHPTVTGTFNIYVKYTSQLMTGPGYYLPNVPYVMYFYEAYAIHGTYWHNNFGHPMSHGCLNLPTPAAKWMYNWAAIGTPVNVHY